MGIAKKRDFCCKTLCCCCFRYAYTIEYIVVVSKHVDYVDFEHKKWLKISKNAKYRAKIQIFANLMIFGYDVIHDFTTS